ncbi:MAG: HI1506-related protein [Nitrospirota bacterium]
MIITVTSKSELGFRRCGTRFTREPQDVEVDAKTLAVLKAETNLVVVETTEKAKTPPPPVDTAKELIEKIKTMTDVAALGELFKGETRSTVKDALKARIKELKDAEKK